MTEVQSAESMAEQRQRTVEPLGYVDDRPSTQPLGAGERAQGGDDFRRPPGTLLAVVEHGGQVFDHLVDTDRTGPAGRRDRGRRWM